MAGAGSANSVAAAACIPWYVTGIDWVIIGFALLLGAWGYRHGLIVGLLQPRRLPGRRLPRRPSGPRPARRRLGVPLRARDRPGRRAADRQLRRRLARGRRPAPAQADPRAARATPLDRAGRRRRRRGAAGRGRPGRRVAVRRGRAQRARRQGAAEDGAALGDPREPERSVPALGGLPEGAQQDRPRGRDPGAERRPWARPTRSSPRTPRSGRPPTASSGCWARPAAWRSRARAGSPRPASSSPTRTSSRARRTPPSASTTPTTASTPPRSTTTPPTTSRSCASTASAARRCRSTAEVESGTSAAVLGYPENGPFTISPARAGPDRDRDQRGLLRTRPDPAFPHLAARPGAQRQLGGPARGRRGAGADDRVRRDHRGQAGRLRHPQRRRRGRGQPVRGRGRGQHGPCT